ncbi:MAG: hypothetical protein AB8G18_05035 [Gammaproteobacteria bacterium]
MRIMFVALLGCLLTGCVSMQSIGEDLSDEQVYHKIGPGDELIIELKTLEKIKVIVTKVTEEQIEADGQVYKFEDIKEIKKKGVSVWKTAGAVIGTFYLYAAFALALAIGSL